MTFDKLVASMSDGVQKMKRLTGLDAAFVRMPLAAWRRYGEPEFVEELPVVIDTRLADHSIILEPEVEP